MVDGERGVGFVARMIALPVVRGARGRARRRRATCSSRSCATRSARSTRARGAIDVDLGFLGSEGVDIDVFTLFPQWFDWFREPAPRGERARAGLDADVRRLPRPHAAERGARSTTRRSAAAPAWSCAWTSWRRRCGRATAPTRSTLRRGRRVIALTPGGRLLDDALAAELAAEPALTLLCGRYEGFDERILEHFCTDAVSIGRYVLAGGELAAMVVCDAVLRKLPGRARPRGLGGRGVVLEALEGAPGVPALHAAGRLARAGRCPTCCSPAITPAIREWRLRAVARARCGGGDARPGGRWR